MNMKNIRIFEAFAGYGAPSLALKRLKQNYPDFDYNIVGMSEIEPNAIKAYKALHGDVKNYGSITDIVWEDVPDFDLFFYGFPCTDLSSAGQQKGMEKGSGTRSSLLWECERAIERKRPAICIMENVVALISKKFIRQFSEWQNVLDRLGYANFTQVMDSCKYGIPQHRERVFMVSILRTEDNPEPKYYFPKPFPLKKRLKDVLEQNVDESYYLKQEYVERIVSKDVCGFLTKFNEQEIVSGTITGQYGQRESDTSLIDEKVYTVGCYAKTGFCSKGMVLMPGGISPTVLENHGVVNAVVEPKIIQRGHGFNKGGVFDCCPTVTSISFENNNIVYRESKNRCTDHKAPHCVFDEYTFRKLTPRELFRLMDVSDEDIDKIQSAGISKSSQYRLAGNSIVVSCLYHIFVKLFIETKADSGQQLQLF